MTARRPAVSALVAGLIAATGLWAVPADATSTVATTSATTYQSQAFRATNQQRVRHDRRRLDHGDCVQRFAVRQARRMANQERIFHQDLRVVMRRCGLNRAGENVAVGYPTGRSVVNDGWMRSAGHRRNILDRGFRLLGMGARKGDDGRWYAAQVFGRKAR